MNLEEKIIEALKGVATAKTAAWLFRELGKEHQTTTRPTLFQIEDVLHHSVMKGDVVRVAQNGVYLHTTP